MPDKKENYSVCARCGRKYKPVNDSPYCGIRCRTSTNKAKKLAVDLVKEIYLLISNEKLFSVEEIGWRLRNKDMKEKFEKVLFVGDKDDNEDK